MPVIDKAKDVYKEWVQIHRHISRVERFGIGLKIDSLFLDLLDSLRKAFYSNTHSKIEILNTSIQLSDSLKFFIQILWETKTISSSQFTLIGQGVEDIGRIIGGWKKGIQTKLPHIGEER